MRGLIMFVVLLTACGGEMSPPENAAECQLFTIELANRGAACRVSDYATLQRRYYADIYKCGTESFAVTPERLDACERSVRLLACTAFDPLGTLSAWPEGCI